MIDYHGAFKPDGLRRTYPNLMTREGVMGKEYLKWSARTTPAHNATLPFTRMLAGPMDYTPGAFGNSNLENFVPRSFMPMGLGTRAQELALLCGLRERAGDGFGLSRALRGAKGVRLHQAGSVPRGTKCGRLAACRCSGSRWRGAAATIGMWAR